MAIEIAQIPTGASSYFKPDNHVGEEGVLVEVTSVVPDVPTQYGPKLTVYATITHFAGKDDKSPTVTENVAIQQQYLAEPLQALVGKAAILKLAKGNAKPGRQAPWIWETPSGEVQQAVIDYATKREADLEAAAADAPSF